MKTSLWGSVAFACFFVGSGYRVMASETTATESNQCLDVNLTQCYCTEIENIYGETEEVRMHRYNAKGAVIVLRSWKVNRKHPHAVAEKACENETRRVLACFDL